MAEVFALAASVVSIAAPALSAVQHLLDDIRNIADAPDAIKTVQDDLVSMDEALRSLGAVTDEQWTSLGGHVKSASEHAVATCSTSCDKFRSDLVRWTKRSKDGKLSWWDRTNVGLFKQRRMASISSQLQACKVTLNSVVSAATLHSSLQHTNLTEELKSQVSGSIVAMNGAISETNKQLVEVNGKLAGLALSDGRIEAIPEEQEVCDVVETDREFIGALLVLLKDTQAKLQEEMRVKETRERQMPQVTFGTGNLGIQLAVNYGPISGLTFGGPPRQ